MGSYWEIRETINLKQWIREFSTLMKESFYQIRISSRFPLFSSKILLPSLGFFLFFLHFFIILESAHFLYHFLSFALVIWILKLARRDDVTARWWVISFRSPPPEGAAVRPRSPIPLYPKNHQKNFHFYWLEQMIGILKTKGKKQKQYYSHFHRMYILVLGLV